MTPAVWLILTLVVSAVAVLSILSNLLTRTPRPLRDLADAFPSVEPQPDASRGSARGFIAVIGSRRAEVDWRWASDADHLHLTHSRGLIGAGVSASIPWAVIRLEEAGGGHMGEFASLHIDERFTLVLPAAAIANELSYLREQAGPAEAPTPPRVLIDAPPKEG